MATLLLVEALLVSLLLIEGFRGVILSFFIVSIAVGVWALAFSARFKAASFLELLLLLLLLL